MIANFCYDMNVYCYIRSCICYTCKRNCVMINNFRFAQKASDIFGIEFVTIDFTVLTLVIASQLHHCFYETFLNIYIL